MQYRVTRITRDEHFPHVEQPLPSLHCTVVGFTLDWESNKSLRYNRECLTELLERAFF